MKIKISDISLEPPEQKVINQSTINSMRALSPRRICFANTHRNALKRSDKPYAGIFSVPFEETVHPLFSAHTNLPLFYNPKYEKYWRSIRSEDEYTLIDSFFQKYQDIVFIRDTLALSLALSLRIDNVDVDTQKRTTIGELEYQAKYQHNDDAMTALADLMFEFCSSTPFYKNMKAFCAVPPSDITQKENLPRLILAKMAAKYGITDISSSLSWKTNKPTLKNISIDEKWAVLEQTGLSIAGDIHVDEVILVDDLYQSGLTMQYVAMKLQEAGVKQIFGLAIVKSLSDNDNQS